MTDTTLPTADQVQSWPGRQVKDSAGTALGTVRSVYGDDDTGLPEWIEVALLDDGLAYVPVLGTSARADELRVAHAADRVASAPRFAADAKLEVADERALYDHYGVETSQELSDTLLPAAADAPGDTASGSTVTPEPPAAVPPPVPVVPAVTVPPAPVAAPPAPVRPAAATPPPLTPVPSAPYGAEGSGTTKKAALLLGVPVALLVAKRLLGGGLLPRRRRSPAARSAVPAASLLLPVAAGGTAAVLQRRTRREQQHPVEIGTCLTGPVVVGAASVPADRT